VKDLLTLIVVIAVFLDGAVFFLVPREIRRKSWWRTLPGSGFYLLLSSRWPFPAPNGWFSITFAKGHYVELHLLPELIVAWISHNRSLHLEVRWLVFEAKLNTFWKRHEAAPAFYAEEDSE